MPNNKPRKSVKGKITTHTNVEVKLGSSDSSFVADGDEGSGSSSSSCCTTAIWATLIAAAAAVAVALILTSTPPYSDPGVCKSGYHLAPGPGVRGVRCYPNW